MDLDLAKSLQSERMTLLMGISASNDLKVPIGPCNLSSLTKTLSLMNALPFLNTPVRWLEIKNYFPFREGSSEGYFPFMPKPLGYPHVFLTPTFLNTR